MANNDNGTPLSRLKSAVEALTRAEQQHAEKVAVLKSAQLQYEMRATEEAHAAKVLESALAAVRRAAKDVE